MTEPEMVAAHIAAHGVTVCPPGAVSKHIKFPSTGDETFAYWELGDWNPGELDFEFWIYGGSPKHDMREEWIPPELAREMPVDLAMSHAQRAYLL